MCGGRCIYSDSDRHIWRAESSALGGTREHLHALFGLLYGPYEQSRTIANGPEQLSCLTLSIGYGILEL